MILNRLGNKKKISAKIQKHFPPHSIYIEPFFGAGGMFFNKPKVQYNILNDLDSEVFNLFQVVSSNLEELKELYSTMPIHADLLDYWKENKETDPVRSAARFLFLSNFCINGCIGTLRLGATGGSTGIYNNFFKRLNATTDYIKGVQFSNKDFRELFSSISLDDRQGKGESSKSFIYADPPYLGTNDNYSNSFKENDSEDLFNILIDTGINFAMSEFDHPFILSMAKKHELNVIEIGERQNIKNRRLEILVTNYKNQNRSLFDL